MALSGSYDYALTAAQLIAGAFRLIGKTTPTTTQNTNALQTLELILKSLNGEGFNLVFPWIQEWITQALEASTVSYTLNQKVVTIDQAFLRRDSYDTPVIIIGNEEYFALGAKATEGLPNQIWMDKQIDGTKIYLFPVPENATDILHMLVVNKFQDIDSDANNIDVNAAWFLALKYQLAAELAPEFNLSTQDMAGLFQMAVIKKSIAANSSGDVTSVILRPSRYPRRG